MPSLPDHAMCDSPAPGLNRNSVQRRGLNDLSNETTVEVLSQLSYMQLLHCRQVSFYITATVSSLAHFPRVQVVQKDSVAGGQNTTATIHNGVQCCKIPS